MKYAHAALAADANFFQGVTAFFGAVVRSRVRAQTRMSEASAPDIQPDLIRIQRLLEETLDRYAGRSEAERSKVEQQLRCPGK